MIGAWLAAARLCGAILATWPELPADRACSASLAIVAVESPRWPSEYVAAVAYHESGFRLDAVGDRAECGPMQVWFSERTRAQLCAEARRDVFAAYRQGVERLDLAQSYCAGRGRPDAICAANVYACGPRCWRMRRYGEAGREFIELADKLRVRLAPRAAGASS